MKEIWKTIEEFSDYAISNFGKVKRIKQSRNNHKVKKILKESHSSPKNKILKNSALTVTLYKEGKPHCRFVSRLVLTTFKEKPPFEGAEGNHKDGIRKNNYIDNLEWVTGIENIHHALKTGLRKNQARGEKIARSKLKETDIPKIRKMLKEGLSLQDVGNNFNVDRCCIFDIKHNRTWKHIS